MRALTAAIAFVLVIGVVLPAQADARARDYRFNVFGGHWMKVALELEQYCGNPQCEDDATFSYGATFSTRFRGSGSRTRPVIDSIRMTVRKDLPGQRRDKVLKRRTWRNVRLGFPLEFFFWGCSSVSDPPTTEYYAKVRIKRTKTSPAIWLRSNPIPLRLPWECNRG